MSVWQVALRRQVGCCDSTILTSGVRVGLQGSSTLHLPRLLDSRR
ncbi:MAG: hypothetical protein ACI8Y4_002445 [Candidatus Poriferisodalaceae bacterium]|jgi:hypothetical protein